MYNGGAACVINTIFFQFSEAEMPKSLYRETTIENNPFNKLLSDITRYMDDIIKY